MTTHSFFIKRDASTNNLVDRVRWCRNNLGERGYDWTYTETGSMWDRDQTTVGVLRIHNEKSAVIYEMFNE